MVAILVHTEYEEVFPFFIKRFKNSIHQNMAALSAWCGTIGVCVILLYGGVLLLTSTGLAWFLTKHDRNRANNQTPFPWEEVWGMKECCLICKFCEEADSGLSFPLSMVPLIPPDPSSPDTNLQSNRCLWALRELVRTSGTSRARAHPTEFSNGVNSHGSHPPLTPPRLLDSKNL